MSQCLWLFHPLSPPLLWCRPSLQPGRRGQSLPSAGDFTLLTAGAEPAAGRTTARLGLHYSAPLLVSPILISHDSSHSASPTQAS